MTDLLLHPSLVVELLVDEDDPRRESLLHRAESIGDGLWLPLAGIGEMIARLADRLGGGGAGESASARSRLRSFGDRCTWLGSPAGDAALIDAEDMVERQVAGGLRRLGPGARLLVLQAGSSDSITLTDYLAGDDQATPLAFIDLARQQRRIRARIESGLLNVLAHGRYIGGPEIAELERRLADFVGVRHAVAVSNGTDALLIAMMAAGVRAGDEVITSPFTFAATGEMIHLLGAQPVYVDIDPRTYNLDAGKLEAAVSARTRVILPVSIFGQCADMDEISAVADARGIAVIEDAAQSFGATYKGRRSGALSDIGCTSFFPSKPLGGYGDSGACFTDDDDLAQAMGEIRDHGQSGRYHHTRLGLNGRMSSFQAAILLAKLDIFESEIRLRGEVAARYDRLFAERGAGIARDDLITPHIKPGNTCAWAQYSLLVRDRDSVQKHLGERGIPTAVHYPIPLNRQPAMRDASCSVPICEDVSSRVLSIPMHPYLGEGSQGRVVDALVDALGGARRVMSKAGA